MDFFVSFISYKNENKIRKRRTMTSNHQESDAVNIQALPKLQSRSRLRGRVVSVLCTCSMLLSCWVFAPLCCRCALRHLGQNADGCNVDWHVYAITRPWRSTCLVIMWRKRWITSIIRFAWLANKLPMSWDLNKGSIPYIILTLILLHTKIKKILGLYPEYTTQWQNCNKYVGHHWACIQNCIF